MLSSFLPESCARFVYITGLDTYSCPFPKIKNDFSVALKKPKISTLTTEKAPTSGFLKENC